MLTSEFIGCVYSTLLAWNHLESLTDSHMKNDRLFSPAELIKCLAVSSWIQESYFCLDFYFNFSKVDCRTLCLERIFWALQTVLHIILIKGTNGFIPLSAALVHMFGGGTEAPRLLSWELGSGEGCPEKSLAAWFSPLAESHPATRQAAAAFEFQFSPENLGGVHSTSKDWRKAI